MILPIRWLRLQGRVTSSYAEPSRWLFPLDVCPSHKSPDQARGMSTIYFTRGRGPGRGYIESLPGRVPRAPWYTNAYRWFIGSHYPSTGSYKSCGGTRQLWISIQVSVVRGQSGRGKKKEKKVIRHRNHVPTAKIERWDTRSRDGLPWFGDTALVLSYFSSSIEEIWWSAAGA